MFRRWPTILSAELPEKLSATATQQLDSDVIMTATILGFTAGRLAQGHPVTYTYDHDDIGTKKAREMSDAVDRINYALGKKYRFRERASAEPAPAWRPEQMITGSPGTASTPFAERHRLPRAEAAQILRTLAAGEGEDAIGYQGPGAYTGFVDDPVNDRGSIQSTKRYNVPRHGYGERWVPTTYTYPDGDQSSMPWGLIGQQRSVGKGMIEQPFDMDEEGAVVGYTHGMVQAIYDAARTGPWCTPYEIAVGAETTKLASCFTCSIFMYANGYPPSAIHLGHGNSWVPFYELRPDDVVEPLRVLPPESPTTTVPSTVTSPVLLDLDSSSSSATEDQPLLLLDDEPSTTTTTTTTDPTTSRTTTPTTTVPKQAYTYEGSTNRGQALTDSVIAALNERWRIECRQHLLLGLRIMQQNDMAAIEEAYHPRVKALETFLNERTDNLYAAANLILDAVTVHDGEVARIRRTLVQP